MNKLLARLCIALMISIFSALTVAQSATDAAQGQDAVNEAASDEDQEELADAAQAEQDSSSQDVAQVEAEEEDSSGRFIPTEQLSQDLGASFPVDI